MRYVSTKSKSSQVRAHEAILQGLAPDGGLYVPDSFPTLGLDTIGSLCDATYEERATHILSLYFDEYTSEEIKSFTLAAYGEKSFPRDDTTKSQGATRQAPVVKVGNDHILELWHGPTSAFKDMALQLLPHLLKASIEKAGESKNVLILTATSGDTGKAALEGFRDIDRTKIMVFYPAEGVSEIQALQMNTQVGRNVHVQAVKGNFDDTQTAVKAIFSDSRISEELEASGWRLSSANSINWGRLLPQIVYYVSAYCDLVSTGEVELGSPVNFCVPTGNFGNILAAFYAQKMGLPINKLICASNENNILTDFIRTGKYDVKREFFCTISPSMDILVSSNLERLLYDVAEDNELIPSYMRSLASKGEYEVSAGILDRIQHIMWADFCTEEGAKKVIRQVWDKYDYLLDPHTAVAYDVCQKYKKVTGDTTPTVTVATANPYKFCETVLESIADDFHDKVVSGSGLELIHLLYSKTGVPVPKPIADLEFAKTRFTGVIEKSEMAACVKDFADK
jgi:threonine synthase